MVANPHFTGPPKSKQVKQDVTVISAALHYIARSLFKDTMEHMNNNNFKKNRIGRISKKNFKHDFY